MKRSKTEEPKPIRFPKPIFEKIKEDLKVNDKVKDLYALFKKYRGLWAKPSDYDTFIKLYPIEYGATPLLHWAIEKNHGPLVKHLLEKVTDIDHYGSRTYPPALHYGAMFGANAKVMRMVVEKGANVNSEDLDGMAALDYLLGYDRVSTSDTIEVAQLLLEKGAVINTFRLPILSAVRTEDVDLVALLIRYGANLTVKDEEKRTVLHHAALTEIDKLGMIKLLLEHEEVVDMINDLDTYDESALDKVMGCKLSEGRIEGVKLLKLRGAYVRRKSQWSIS